ncbi:hypothetical protein Lesp02_36170 [Lentzea sp. NBRC 105346]|uniref:LCP family protein n=1 Tax=Lentzea sp. NBRC 105346 TaxID=3032205 RepID=UPI0024A06172|nr:LCP family protein [Lentzea sp. NBRC 105346]GLZ31429.1 hypothetical protein Lesp02_36170 [Lentzea sp. NBRC 105346]
MEGSGGLSVSDLVERHSRTNIPRPVPPAPAPQHHQAPPPAPPRAQRPAEPPARAAEATGRRAMPPNGMRPPAPPRPEHQPPTAERTGTRPRPQLPPEQARQRPAEPNGVHQPPTAERTGTRPRPVPPRAEVTGTRPRPAVDPNGVHLPPTAEQTGTRPRPTPPGGIQMPPKAEQTGTRPRPGMDTNGVHLPTADQTGTRPRPGADPNGVHMPPKAEQTGTRPRPGIEPNGVHQPPKAEQTGTRPRPGMDANGVHMPPKAEQTGTRPRPGMDANGVHLPTTDQTGTRPRPGADPNGVHMPPKAEQTGTRPRPGVDANGVHMPPTAERTGTRPRPVPPGQQPPQDQTGTRPGPEGTGMQPRPTPPGRPGMPPQGGEATGLHPMPSRAESSGPRPMPARAESSGPRPAPNITNRLGGGDAPAAEAPAPEAPAAPVASAAPVAPATPRPETRDEIDPLSLTTEMEAIGDEVKKRREVDHTLARFSAVHDELLEQERQRKERRSKLMPWRNDNAEDATQFAEPATMFVESDPEPESRRAGRTPQQKKMMRLAKVTAIAAAAVVFLSTGIGWAAKLWIDRKFQKIDALGGNSAAVQQAEKQLGDENFLIVGSDTRAGAKAGDNVGTQASEPGARSDVVMLAHIPKDRKRVVVVSLPRDVVVDIPPCERWDANTGKTTGEKVPEQKGVKANEAYATGGPRCVTDMMTQLTGLKINHFVSIDFNGFRQMSTAVGGVTVCVSKPIIDDELGTVLPKAGKHEISGDVALQFVRARKVQGDLFGDYDRITRQQQFLSAMLRQALSSQVLLNPTKLNNFINAFAQSTVGDNVGVDQLLTLGQSLQGLEAGRVSFVTMPHVTDDNRLKDDPSDNIERLKDGEVKALFQSIIDGTPLPLEKQDPNAGKPSDGNAPPKQGQVVAPNQVSVQVLNGDAENGGAAGRTRTALEKQGFKVVNVGDTAPAQKTIIKYAKGREDWAATLAAAVPTAEKVEDPSMGGAVVLILGTNYDDKVVAPQAGSTAGEPGKPNVPQDLSIVNGGQDPCAK